VLVEAEGPRVTGWSMVFRTIDDQTSGIGIWYLGYKCVSAMFSLDIERIYH
jgi:hypothetical protein